MWLKGSCKHFPPHTQARPATSVSAWIGVDFAGKTTSWASHGNHSSWGIPRRGERASLALFLNSKFSVLFRLNFYRSTRCQFRVQQRGSVKRVQTPILSHVSRPRALRSKPVLRAGYRQLPLRYTAGPTSVPTAPFTAPTTPC